MMKKVISFRPNVINNGTAFECMALIYKYLQNHFGYKFTIIKSDDDKYQDPNLEVISIPESYWKPVRRTPLFIYPQFKKKCIDNLFSEADLLLTVDPTIYPQGLLAIRAAHRLHKPVWFDASLTTMGAGKNFYWKLIRPIIRKALYQTTGIIITVPKCIERFLDLGLFDEEISKRFTLMGHPVDTKKFIPLSPLSESDGIVRIIVVSRFIPEKGLYYILEAMTPLLRSQKNLRLQLLGTGPMKGLLVKEINFRGLNGKVEFLGPTDHDQLPKILGAADIYINHAVSTSNWEEFFGAANIEAMACGLPCIVSKSGGIPYVIRDENAAILVDERNVSQLRTAVSKFIASKKFRKKFGAKARHYVQQHYDISLIALKYHRMLQNET